MIGSKCKHKGTGHEGIIRNELPNCWGIYWFQGSDGDKHAKHIKGNGLLHYWQDKKDIEILKSI